MKRIRAWMLVPGDSLLYFGAMHRVVSVKDTLNPATLEIRLALFTLETWKNQIVTVSARSRPA